MIGTSATRSPKLIVGTTAAFLLAIIALDCPLFQYYHSSVETNKNYAPNTLYCFAFRTSILPSSIRQPASSSSSLLPASLYYNKGKFTETRLQGNSLLRSISRRKTRLSMTNTTAEISSASLEVSDSLNSSSVLQTYIDSLLSGSSSSLSFCKLVPSSYNASVLTRTLAQQNTNNNATSTLIREVNTIVFRPVGSIDNENENDIPIYAVAILPSSEKVDVRRFSQELQAFQAEQQSSQNNSAGIDLVGGIHHHQYDDWELAPSDMVQKLCGFRPGTVPPLLVPPLNNPIAGSSNTSTIDITEGIMSHINRPFATIVDSSLLWSNSTSSSNGDNTMNSRKFILGGGGSADRFCLIDLEFFLRDVLNVSATNSEHRNAKIASIIRFDGGIPNVYSGSTNGSRQNRKRQDQSQQQQDATIEQPSTNNNAPNPFFQIAPPIDATAMGLDGSQQSFPTAEQRASHRPIPVTAIGRLSSVRQIAKKLVFADFCPPDYNLRHFNNNNHSQRDEAKATSNNHLQRPPWRSGEDGMDMHVQIIVGKTFCERYDDGMQRLKTLKPGKLVLIRGAANVDPMQKNGWRNSAGNWAQKRSLDVIVSSFEILDEAENDIDDSMRRLVEEAQREVASRGSTTTATSTNGMSTNWNSLLPWERKSDFQRRAIAGSDNTDGSDTFDSTNELTLSRFNAHLRDTPLGIRIVNDDDSLQNMVTEVSELFGQIEKKHHQAKNNNNDNLLDYVAGIDCEWRPTGAYAEALLEGPDDNPVALLQICLPIIDAVYLVDTHRLLRSNLDEHETMTENEKLLSEAIELIFGSKTMIKAGYSVVIDFRRLAASFPHVPSFKTVRSVVELSYLAERLHPKSSKPLLGSLQKLTKLVLGYNIAKEEQCSNWEARPLSSSQIEYATLDCALPPRLLDEMAEGSGNAKIREVLPGVTRSYRFQTIDSSRKDAIRRLKAKRVVGNTFLISQCWLSNRVEPVPTSIPEENGGPYIDTDGVLKMPADVIRIGHVDAPWRSMSGKTVLKSSESGPGGKKSDCINLLVGDTLPQDTVLECSPRSGFIEFKDGLALFVNMQDPNRPSRRKMPYPNDFLEDGRILTWYIRKKDWNNGNSEVAKLLLGSHSNNGSQADDSVESISIPSSVVLFVRVGSGDFVCCGSCTATEANDYSSSKLAKLNLRLNDWHKMKGMAAFSKLLGDLVPRTKPALSSEDDPSVLRKNLAQVIVDGNMVGAFGMALDTFKVSTENRSISYARNCVANILCGSNDPLVLEAMDILNKMTI